jgi:hypothetical protein
MTAGAMVDMDGPCRGFQEPATDHAGPVLPGFGPKAPSTDRSTRHTPFRMPHSGTRRRSRKDDRALWDLIRSAPCGTVREDLLAIAARYGAMPW